MKAREVDCPSRLGAVLLHTITRKIMYGISVVMIMSARLSLVSGVIAEANGMR